MKNRISDRKWESALFLALLVAAALFLNLDFLHFRPLFPWAKLVPPLLMIGGFAGCVFGLKILMVVGWTGIGLFTLVALASSAPSEDYLLLSRESSTTTAARLAVGLAISLLLALCYRKLRTASRTDIEEIFS